MYFLFNQYRDHDIIEVLIFNTRIPSHKVKVKYFLFIYQSHVHLNLHNIKSFLCLVFLGYNRLFVRNWYMCLF